MDTNLGCDSFKKRFRYLQYDVQYCPKPRIACIRHTEPSLRYRVPKVRCGMGNKTNSLSPCLPLSRVYVTQQVYSRSMSPLPNVQLRNQVRIPYLPCASHQLRLFAGYHGPLQSPSNFALRFQPVRYQIHRTN
jgi:hypothetical protein